MNLRSPLSSFVLIAALAAAGPALGHGAPSVADGTFGPYLQNATPSSIIVCWRTATAGTSEVDYGTTTAYGKTLQALASTQWHQVPITGLSSNTLYQYRATTRVNGQSIWSETGSFRTNFAGVQPFSFVQMAETHDEDVVENFKEEVLAANPHLIVDASDQVDDGARLEEWDHYFTIGQSFYRHFPVYNAVGNHTYSGTGWFKLGIFGNIDLFRQIHALPGNEEYYTVRYGNVLFIYLNSTWYFDPWRLSTKQVSWLKKTLAEATDGKDDPVWKVAVYHTPSYSSGPVYREYLERIWTRNFLVKHLKGAKTDLVLVGHDKFNEHSIVDGIHHVQVATGELDAKRIKSKNPHKKFLSAQTQGMGVFSVNGRKIDAKIVDQQGNTLYSFSLAK